MKPKSRLTNICKSSTRYAAEALMLTDRNNVVQVLKKIAWFVVLAPTSPDQITLLNGTAADRKLTELPLYKELLSNFLTKEVL